MIVDIFIILLIITHGRFSLGIFFGKKFIPI